MKSDKTPRAEKWVAFWRGFGSVLNIFGGIERPAFMDRTDEEALRGDWEAVGGDLQKAIEAEGARRGR